MKPSSLAGIEIPPATPIREAIESIDRGGKGIALVTDDGGRLLGTVTDGDVRRAILKGLDISGPVEGIMNRNPTTATEDFPRRALLHLMRTRSVRQLPIVDEEGRVLRLATLGEIVSAPEPGRRAVVMAGGYGRRLRPLTEELPKPMLAVGGRPILEIIVERLREAGVRDIALAVHFKYEVIEEYFQDGSHMGVSIEYVKEREPLGTAGALSLVERPFDAPFLVMNGDILTKVNFESLFSFHEEQGAAVTMGVKHFDLEVPYGVVEVEEARITSLEEKPKQEFFVNAGLYVLSPEAVSLVPKGDFYNITDLIGRLLGEGRTVGGFPITEYWSDIGSLPEYRRADSSYRENFE